MSNYEENQRKGFVKMYRSILNWEWYKKVNTRIVFFHFLLSANYKDTTFEGRVIKRGQLVTGTRETPKEIGLTVSKYRTALLHLKLTHEITQQAFAEYTIHTIVNYDEYQGLAQDLAHKSHTNRTQIATSKEIKKLRKKEVSLSVDKTDKKSSDQNRATPEFILNAWNRILGPEGFSRVRVLSDKRLKAIKKAIRQIPKKREWENLILQVSAEPYRRGDKFNGWMASFDWVVNYKTERYVEIYEEYKTKNDKNLSEGDQDGTARRLCLAENGTIERVGDEANR